jgi:hypothetical protein
MEMFNKKVLNERIGSLKKNQNLRDLEDVEGYVIRKCKELDIEHSYDVLAEEMPYFKTMGYTEFAGNFYLQPLNLKFRLESITDGWYDTDTYPAIDFASHMAKRVIEKTANKYQSREQDFEQYRDVEYLAVLPGSNKLKGNTCLNKLKYLKKKYKDNLYFKPHPITTHAVVGELKDLLGAESILPRDIDLYHFMNTAKKIYSTHWSESVINAISLGNPVEAIDVYNDIHQSSFYAINTQAFAHQHHGKKWINKTFSSPKSGIINPYIDKDWKDKVDKYFDYITEKRDYYKLWFIDEKLREKLKKKGKI